MVQAIYAFAIPDLHKNGVVECSLEVIIENQRAIKSYQNIGFTVSKIYRCFKGELKLKKSELRLEETKYENINWSEISNQEAYSWDYQKESLRNGNYKFYKVFFEDRFESFFAMHPDNDHVAQFEILTKIHDAYKRLFAAISMISKKIVLNNVDEQLIEKIDFLNQLGLKNYVSQYQMKLTVPMKK